MDIYESDKEMPLLTMTVKGLKWRIFWPIPAYSDDLKRVQEMLIRLKCPQMAQNER